MGSGGVGGYFGARLVQGGADVHFIARGAHLAAMREHGLAIEGGPQPIHLPKVSVSDEAKTIGPVDVVMFCVKLWDTEIAARQVLPLMQSETAVISFQNGVQKDDMLRPIVGEKALVGGVAYVGTTIGRPGVIVQTGSVERVVFGEYDGRRSARVDAFHAASMRQTIGPIRSNPLTRQFLLELAREVVAVGRAHGVALPEDYAEQRMPFFDAWPPEMAASMYHDLQQGKPLELRWLSGGVVDLGAAVGVPTPTNRAVRDI